MKKGYNGGIRMKGDMAYGSMVYSAMKYKEGYSYRAIGEILGVSGSSVYSKIQVHYNFMENNPEYKEFVKGFDEKAFYNKVVDFRKRKAKLDAKRFKGKW